MLHAQSLQSCLTLCDPKDSGLPGAYVHGILQARILEWVAMTSALIRRGGDTRALCPSCEDTVRRGPSTSQKKDSH